MIRQSLRIFGKYLSSLNPDLISKIDFWGRKAVASKVDVAPKVEDPVLACIDSIKGQTFLKNHPDKVEVIVVQDGHSKDIQEDPVSEELLEAITGYRSETRFRIFVLAANKGRSAARKVGIYFASNEIVFFVDSSMVLDQNFIAEHMIRHQRIPRVALVGFKQNKFWNLPLPTVQIGR